MSRFARKLQRASRASDPLASAKALGWTPLVVELDDGTTVSEEPPPLWFLREVERARKKQGRKAAR